VDITGEAQSAGLCGTTAMKARMSPPEAGGIRDRSRGGQAGASGAQVPRQRLMFVGRRTRSSSAGRLRARASAADHEAAHK